MKWRVPFEVKCTVWVEVEAGSKADAMDIAEHDVYLEGYVGNGGDNKLMGVSDSNMSVEPGEFFDVIEEQIMEVVER